MPNHSSKPKRPRDVNQLAKAIVDQATGEAAPEPTIEPIQSRLPEREKDLAAVSLGRKGGLKGGKARFAALTQEERIELARKAAMTRWGRAKKHEVGSGKD